MKKNISYLLVIIISIFIGLSGMYLLIHYFPNQFIQNASVVESKVTVTDDGISAGIENVYDSVVVVENYKKEKLYGIGSGFIYSKEGYILTNHHVVEDSTEIKVILMNGETLTATIVGSDQYADIAVIKIDSKYITKVATMGNSNNSKVGDTVFTIGSPIKSEYAGTVTRGILSGKNRMVEVSIGDSYSNDWIMNLMQTDAAINPGNSGGPLCNVSGEVIGINSMKVVQDEIEGVGFAIPIEDALEYAKIIVEDKKIQRPYIGISMQDLSVSNYYLNKEGIYIDSSITSGVIVYDTNNNGPCDKAGIKKGDVIISLDGKNIKNVAELRYYLYKHKPGETIEIIVYRGTTKKTFKVKLETSD